MDWKTRKDRLQADDASVDPRTNPEAVVAPAPTPDRRERPVAKENDEQAYFFDLNNDAFRTDSRRTAIDAYTSPDWMPEESLETPAWDVPSRSHSEDQEAPFPQFAPGHFDEPIFSDTPINGFQDLSYEDEPEFADVSEPPAYTPQAPSWDEPKAPLDPVALDAFAPYQPEPDPNAFSDFQPAPPQPIEDYFKPRTTPTPQPPAPQQQPPSRMQPTADVFAPTPAVPPQPIQNYFAPRDEAPAQQPPSTQHQVQPQPNPQPNPFLAQQQTPAQPPVRPVVPQSQPPRPKSNPAIEDLHPDGMREGLRERPRVPSGLVVTDSETGIPKVAPFIVPAASVADSNVDAYTERSLILKMRNLSATFALTKEITTIGRPDSGTQSYPDIEIELDDSVSRRHAEVRKHGNDFFLVDVGSSNGTMLNGQKLKFHIEMRLAHGDKIRVGERTEIVFE